MMEELLRFEQVSYAYEDGAGDRTALKNCSVSIRAGERIAVLGANGAGKSTFFLLANGVLRPRTGTVFFQGTPVGTSRRELNRLRRERLMERVPELLERAEALPGGGRLVCALVDCDAAAQKELASKLIEENGVAVLLGAKNGEKCNFVFARSADMNLAMGKLLSETAKPLGGKGGGRPDFAQGGGPAEVLDAARAMLMEGGTA